LNSTFPSGGSSLSNRAPRTRFRWVILALLFAATALNYLDRQIIGVLKPTIQAELSWSESDYATLIFWFQAAYATGYLCFGRLIDRVGVKSGLALALFVWTAAHMAHALVFSVLGFALARIMLGLGEGGSFPGGLKAIAEWFPKRERAFAVGVFNSGTNVGAILTPIVVPVITLAFGWRWAIALTGVLGIVWLVGWWSAYASPRSHRRVSASELALIESDPPDPITPTPLRALLRTRELWAYALAKFLIDPVWWLFLFWLPDFFFRTHGLNLKTFGLPLVVIYLASDVGAVAGGWMSSALMASGRSLNTSRKLAMLVSALCVIPVIYAAQVADLWTAVALLGLATAAHQAFSANLFTLPSDLFPRKAVATVVGAGGAVGAIGGMLMAKYVGWILGSVGGYTPIFALCGGLYLVALIIIHLLSPRYEPIKTIL
jgi:MFS transporter, ACS family, hexuronate transporter